MLFTVVTFLLVLALLVFVHESGHYLAARHVGVRVQQFSIGFPPRMVGKKIGETEYIFSWIPLGGYVKLEGQNIEDENPKDPRNYAAKSVPQRFYILAAGPVANLVLALLLMPVVFMLGVETPTYRLGPAELVATTAGSPAEQAGFRAGDRIVGVGAVETGSWNRLFREISRQAVLDDTVPVRVLRGSQEISLSLDSAVINAGKSLGWRPLIPPVIGLLAPGAPAEAAGLRTGDRLVAADGVPVTRWDEIPGLIQKAQGREVKLEIERGGARMDVRVVPEMNKEAGRWLIGISPGTTTQRHGPVEAFTMGAARLWEITAATFMFLGRLVSGNGSMDALGGPVKIGMVVGEAARMGAANLIFLMAVISLQLGIFNLLPIPALDGGHIFMLGLELIKGKPLSARLRERAQLIGFSLLILLILIVTYNDIVRIVT